MERNRDIDGIFVAARYERWPCPWRPWVYYVINDRDTPIEHARLRRVCFDWGDYSSETALWRNIKPVKPRSFRKIWRSESSELSHRMILDVTTAGTTHPLTYELPRLNDPPRHSDRDALPLVGGRGALAWPEARDS